MSELLDKQIIYIDKKVLPFRPDSSQVIFIDNLSDTPNNVGINNYVEFAFMDLFDSFLRHGYAFLSVNHLMNLFDEDVISYYKPDSTRMELNQWTRSMPKSIHRTILQMLHHTIDEEGNPVKELKYPSLLCYAGPRHDKLLGYAFYLFPYQDNSLKYDRFFQLFFPTMEALVWNIFDHIHGAFKLNREQEFSIMRDTSTICLEKAEDVLHSKHYSSKPSTKMSECCPMEEETIAETHFSTEVYSMLDELRQMVALLRKKGVSQWIIDSLIQPTHTLSRLHIKDTRIFLTDYNNMEIMMGPLPKAVFFLFLRYPEGINFSYLPDYRKELFNIYSLLSAEEDEQKMRKSVMDVTDPTRNTINENASRIRRAFVEKIDPELAKHYFLTGLRGEPKKILLPRDQVIWEGVLA